MASVTAESVVEATLKSYAALPKHGKPSVRDNGVPEWTILASISLTLPDAYSSTATNGTQVVPISIGTGVKVLPAARLPPLGDTVHDCHAEVLARRGFVRWLLDQATRVARGEEHAGLVLWDAETKRFSLAPGVQAWLYVSALPVGVAQHVLSC